MRDARAARRRASFVRRMRTGVATIHLILRVRKSACCGSGLASRGGLDLDNKDRARARPKAGAGQREAEVITCSVCARMR